jgi:hypothetical protein
LHVLILTALLMGVSVPLRAQVAAPSSIDINEQPAGEESPSPSAAIATPTPIPDVPELSKLDEAFKRTSIGQAADESRHRVEIRKLQNRVSPEESVVAARKAADAAKTDLEKRNLLREYYDLYYGKMRRLASDEETRKALDEQKAAHVKLLDQPHVRPVPGASPPPPPKKDKAAKPKKSRFGRTNSQ